LNGVGEFFVDLLTDFDDDIALKVLDLVEGNAADDAIAQRLNFDAGFDDGLDVDAVSGAAILLVVAIARRVWPIPRALKAARSRRTKATFWGRSNVWFGSIKSLDESPNSSRPRTLARSD